MSALTASVTPGREPAGNRIMVTVGTDHHQFDRLIGWINDWLSQHPGHVRSFFIQSGAASVEPACPGTHFMAADELSEQLDQADVMVCHGGPGSIADAWARGQVPIVVPRLRRFGEVVDDHQVDFCRKLAGLGRVRLAEDPATLARLLDEAVADTGSFRAAGLESDSSAAVARFSAAVAALISAPPRRRGLARRIRGQPETSAGAPGAIAPGAVPAGSANWNETVPSARMGLAGTANEEQE